MRLDHKNFKNDICRACIRRNQEKYGRFSCDCAGISVEEDVKDAIQQGYTEEQARWAYDPVFFFDTVYGKPARNYQRKLLYCTSKKLAARQCRQTGKTLIIMYKIFHYVLTNDNVTVLVITPNEAQIKKIWDEYLWRDCIYKNDIVKSSVVSKTQSPYRNIVFDNGSMINMMIASPAVRGQTGAWIYIDEAAIISQEILSDILMAIASKGDEASMIMTSTPKGRGNPFYEACKNDPQFAEFHTSIWEVDEMRGQAEFFRKKLGETGFKQEAEAEFPDVSGGPFNYRGIDLAKLKYSYEDCLGPEPGYLYFGGADWNGPNIGSYFYIIGFNPVTEEIKVVDKKVVSSAVWNSMVAKDTFIQLNRKWRPKHWMVDYGYSQTLVEDLKIWSIQQEQNMLCKPGDPDAMIKHILEAVQFGAWLEIDDPFTREATKKTTRGFIVSQVSRLFEPINDYVKICFSAEDEELITSLENYKIMNITDKGTEQYGFDKKSGLEDHCIDAFNLALYGIVKHYSELFNKLIASSIIINARELLSPPTDYGSAEAPYGCSIILLTDNSPEPIELDSNKLRKFEPKEDDLLPVISRTFDRGVDMGNRRNASKIMARRTNYVIRRDLDL